MQDETARHLGRYRGFHVTFRDDAYFATADEQTYLRSERLGGLIWGIDEHEDYFIRFLRPPRWYREITPGLVLVPCDRLETPHPESDWKAVEQTGIVVRRRADSDPIYVCVVRKEIRAFFDLEQAKLFRIIARTESMSRADENYRHFLSGPDGVWSPDDYRAPIAAPNRRSDFWDLCRHIDPVAASVDPGTFQTELSFAGYRIEAGEDRFYAYPVGDVPKMNLCGESLAALLVTTHDDQDLLVNLADIVGRTGHQDKMAFVVDGKRQPRLPGWCDIGHSTAVVRPYYLEAFVFGSETLYRQDPGPHCERAVWWYRDGDVVRAFTRTFHMLNWRERRKYHGIREADVSHLLDLRYGGEDFPAGF